ncbi:MAG: tRNA lysidine(34) synthetase TilS [Bdellovibrionaceae bacterium]|jgi:tRNA(Ile)-lysidine synthase|nr:tRNA lysidine(34) synthetase TilS [Pseudobdellovibrionaceae bacterium]
MDIQQSSRSSKKKWLALEHKIWREFHKESALHGAHMIVLVSGGKDSVALWQVLRALQLAFRWSLYLAHVHHGGNQSYRQEARDFCAQLALEAQVPFLEATSPRELRAEGEMREFRNAVAQKWYFEIQTRLKQVLLTQASFVAPVVTTSVWLVTAHHADDLLETRLMRLIRGTGGVGLRAMSALSHPRFRPFLNVSRGEIEAYLESRSLAYVEDPSNSNLHYLRNWIRHEWLARLERKRPGAKAALARSLTQIATSSVSVERPYVKWLRFTQDGAVVIPRSWWLRQRLDSQQNMVAYILHRLTKYNYTKGHVDEVIKLWQSRDEDLKQTRVADLLWGGRGPWLYARKTAQG